MNRLFNWNRVYHFDFRRPCTAASAASANANAKTSFAKVALRISIQITLVVTTVILANFAQAQSSALPAPRISQAIAASRIRFEAHNAEFSAPREPLASSSDYYSKTAEEAVLTFDGVYRSQLGTTPSEGDSISEIRQVLTYLPGPLSGGNSKAGSKDQDRFSITQIAPVGAGYYDIHFHYSGVYAVERTHGATINVMLPVNHGTIFRTSQSKGGARCTNAYFSDEDHFWYFWNPLQAGCRLQQGKDYNVFVATLSALPSDHAVRYPDYPRLPDTNGSLNMTLVFGAEKDINGDVLPENARDWDAPNFMKVSRQLEHLGFKRYRWTQDQLANYCPAARGSMQTVEEYIRMDGTRRVDIKMLWGSTGLAMGNHSMPFYCLLNDAMTNSSIFVYNGHSGLGAAIYLDDLRRSTGMKFDVNKNRYQIFSYNGCSSYRYYNVDLFKEKMSKSDPDGTHNLEVVNNGIEGSFGDLADLTLGVVEPVLKWSQSSLWTSYQTMLDSISTGHLTGVNGISDNPSVPYR